MIYAFIPARSGSTRLEDKNYLMLKNKRLFEWSIEAANKSDKIDKIIFSSDSDKYIEYAENIPLNKELLIDKRNEKNASGNMKIYDYLKSDFLDKNNFLNEKDFLVMLLPTQPYRSLTDIKNIVKLGLDSNKNVFSCREYEFPISFAFKIKNKDIIETVFDNSPILTGNTRSQDQDQYFHPDGSVYFLSISSLNKRFESIYQNAVHYEIRGKVFIDIDNESDFEFARNSPTDVITE